MRCNIRPVSEHNALFCAWMTEDDMLGRHVWCPRNVTLERSRGVGPPDLLDTPKTSTLGAGKLPICSHRITLRLSPKRTTGSRRHHLVGTGRSCHLSAPPSPVIPASGGVWMSCWAPSCERDPSAPSNSGPSRCHGDKTICSSEGILPELREQGFLPLIGFSSRS